MISAVARANACVMSHIYHLLKVRIFKVYNEFLISILRYIIKIQEKFGRDYCNIALTF